MRKLCLIWPTRRSDPRDLARLYGEHGEPVVGPASFTRPADTFIESID
jgi:hypothetical protein